MKHIFSAFIALVLVLNLSASAQKQIPPQLHGYWQFKPDKQSGLFGMHIGPNYVEINSYIMMVDSINQSDNENTRLYLSNKKAGQVFFEIKLQANDSALFLPDGKMTWRCKRYDRNPDIDYLPVSEYSKVIVGKWVDVNNTHEPLAIEKGKLLYEGKRWNIDWLGVSMKQEYHALIENKGEYRLIILVKQANNSWNLTFDNNSVRAILLTGWDKNSCFIQHADILGKPCFSSGQVPEFFHFLLNRFAFLFVDSTFTNHSLNGFLLVGFPGNIAQNIMHNKPVIQAAISQLLVFQ